MLYTHVLQSHESKDVFVYIYMAWGLGVARFDKLGNARSLMWWNGQQTGSTFLCMCESQSLILYHVKPVPVDCKKLCPTRIRAWFMFYKAKIRWSALLLFSAVLGLTSCGTTLKVHDITYQSVRNVRQAELKPVTEIGDSASILIEPYVTVDGSIDVYVTNLTDSIMILDRTKSFFVSPQGTSTIYYDPMVRTQTSTHTSGNTKGVGVNLGALGRAAGVGGAVGQILSGINVGGSKQNISTVSNTTYVIDTPTGAVAPHGRASMGRTFIVTEIGSVFCSSLATQSIQNVNQSYDESNSICKFGVCVSYSLDNGKTFRKIVSNYYVNSVMLAKVKQNGKINQELRQLMESKRNLFEEPWYILKFRGNARMTKDYMHSSLLYDYQ